MHTNSWPRSPGIQGVSKSLRWLECLPILCRGLSEMVPTYARATIIALALLGGVQGQAQEHLGLSPSGRPGLEPLPQLPEQPAAPRQVPSLLPLIPLSRPEESQQLPGLQVLVREIRIEGNTVFTVAELEQITAPYTQRMVNAEDLEALRLALTRQYIDRGYINSGAIIPDQTIRNGVLTIRIIEGQLNRIDITGNRWFRTNYLRRRLSLAPQQPLNLPSLQERLQFLQQDERIARLQAELRPGIQRGESVLDVQVTENSPFYGELAFNNYQSPTVGAESGIITLAHRNVTGHGDILSVTYGRSEGNEIQIDANYTLPLTVNDTTLRLQYRRNDFLVIEEPFGNLDVDSMSEVFGVTIRHPLYRTLRQELSIALIAERLHNETFLLGEPFSFSLGAEDGESTVTAFRLEMEWTDRTPQQILAARSRFSIGVGVLGATVHDTRAIPDSEFFAWLGQFQWARRLTKWDIQVIGRVDVQLSTDPLLPLEQLAVGGRFSVRGYRENQLVRDNGVIASLEVRLPVIRNRAWADYVQLVPFVDIGSAWNTQLPTPDPRTILSLGVGLRWALTLATPLRWQPVFEMYWGYPLKDVETAGGDLQDLGLHFQLVLMTL